MKKRELISFIGALSAISITGCGNNNQTVSNDYINPVTEIASENVASVSQDEFDGLNAENEALKKSINDLEAQITEDETYYQSSLDFGVAESSITEVEIIEILDEDRLILQDANIRAKDSIDSEWIDYLLRYIGISEETYIHVYGKTSNGWYEIHYITDESTSDYMVAYVPEKALSDTMYMTEDSSSSSTSDTSDTSDTSSYDLYDSAMNKIDTDPSTLTEEEAAYLKELYPTLTKDPREMTTQEWYAFWDNLYAAGSTSTTTATDCSSDCSSDCGGGDCDADCEVWDCGECYNGHVAVNCHDYSDTSHMDPNWTCDC